MKADCNYAEAKANRAASAKFKALCDLSIREQHRLVVESYLREAKARASIQD